MLPLSMLPTKPPTPEELAALVSTTVVLVYEVLMAPAFMKPAKPPTRFTPRTLPSARLRDKVLLLICPTKPPTVS